MNNINLSLFFGSASGPPACVVSSLTFSLKQQEGEMAFFLLFFCFWPSFYSSYFSEHATFQLLLVKACSVWAWSLRGKCVFVTVNVPLKTCLFTCLFCVFEGVNVFVSVHAQQACATFQKQWSNGCGVMFKTNAHDRLTGPILSLNLCRNISGPFLFLVLGLQVICAKLLRFSLAAAWWYRWKEPLLPISYYVITESCVGYWQNLLHYTIYLGAKIAGRVEKAVWKCSIFGAACLYNQL